MRILCLCFSRNKSKPVDELEVFLQLSPRTQVVEDSTVSIDITQSTHLFGGEQGALDRALRLAADLRLHVEGVAIASHPYTAQAFARLQPGRIVPGDRESEHLKTLPLHAAEFLCGLRPWAAPSRLRQVLGFLEMLGLKSLGDIARFSLSDLQSRWGELGHTLWNRVHGLERQEISPWEPHSPIEDYVYFDEPVSQLAYFLHTCDWIFKKFCQRLQARALFASQLHFTLHCEYSENRHQFSLQPAASCRDEKLFAKLLAHKMSGISLENPVRELEVQIDTVPEKTQQLDFFSAQSFSDDKLLSLISVLRQASLKAGFYRMKDHILPEKSWSLSVTAEEPKFLETVTEKSVHTAGIRTLPVHSEHLWQAPRPSRILKSPKELHPQAVRRLRFLTEVPVERLETEWWSEQAQRRDYYYALSPQSQWLWIYKDLDSQSYYLHGYFD